IGGGINFNGGFGVPDALGLAGGTLKDANLGFSGPDGGGLSFSPPSGAGEVVNFTGVEAVDLSTSHYTVLNLTLTAANDQATFNDGGDAAKSALVSGSGTFPAVLYKDPSTMVALSTGAGNDTVVLRRFTATMSAYSLDAGPGQNSMAVDL